MNTFSLAPLHSSRVSNLFPRGSSLQTPKVMGSGLQGHGIPSYPSVEAVKGEKALRLTENPDIAVDRGRNVEAATPALRRSRVAGPADGGRTGVELHPAHRSESRGSRGRR